MTFEHCDLDSNGRPLLVVRSADGRNFELLCSFDYVARDGRRFRAPIGAVSDGASTPPELWTLLGQQWLAPFGTYWPAVFIHDGGYRGFVPIETLAMGRKDYDPAAEVVKVLQAMREAIGEVR